jgi:hypothetical protein
MLNQKLALAGYGGEEYKHKGKLLIPPAVMKDAEEAGNIKYPCSDTCQCRKQSSKERPPLGEITNNLGTANKKVGGLPQQLWLAQ